MELAMEQVDKKKALDHLRLIIDNGFEDRDIMLSPKVGEQLRDDPEFLNLVDEIDGKDCFNPGSTILCRELQMSYL